MHKFKDDKDHQKDDNINSIITNINQLNNDCLIEIFKYLTMKDRIVIERVCWNWNRLSKLSWSSFKKLNLSELHENSSLFEKNKSNLNNDEIFYKFISKCGKFLNDVNIKGVTCFSKEFNSSLIPYYITNYCDKIVKLVVDGKYFKDPDFYLGFLFYKNKCLKHFEISNTRINGNCLLNLPLDTLEVLILRSVKVSPAIGADLKLFFKSLKVFKIIQELDENFDLLFDNISTDFGPNISELVIINFDPDVPDNQTKNLIKLLSGMKKLKTFILANSEIDDFLLENISADTIEKLIFSNCTISLNCIRYCLKYFKNLNTFALQYMVDVIDLLNEFNGPNLKLLDLKGIWFSEIPSITMHKFFKNLSQIEILDLACCEVNDLLLAIICLNCKFLKALNISDNDDITDTGLAFLKSLPKIEKLFLCSNSKVKGLELMCLVNMKELNLSSCKAIKFKYLCNMLSTCPLIESLNISLCNDSIIDAVIETAAQTKNIRGKKTLNIFISNKKISEMYLKKNISSSFVKVVYDNAGDKVKFSDYEECIV